MQNQVPRLQTNEQRVFFKWIMRNPTVTINKQVEVIDLIYPITMEQISNPVRNSGCNQSKVCVWPLGSLMKEFQEDANREFKDLNSDNLKIHSFNCKMCEDFTKFTKRNYSDFYYDRKLDYLIRAARIKYIESFKDELKQSNDKVKKKILKNFKNSKLFIHRAGGAILQYNKKLSEGGKVTYRAVVFQNTLSHYSEQLILNPKDFVHNLSALKVTQNLCQRRIGQRIEKGLQDTHACFTKAYQQYLKGILQGWIIDILTKNSQTSKKQELYAAKIVLNQSIQNKKVAELILFFPRYNLTQIYPFQENEILNNACSKQILKIIKLPNHQILLYTSELTFIIKLQPNNLLKKQVNFMRPITTYDSNKKELYSQDDVKIQYYKQIQCYHNIQKKKEIKQFDSIRPMIESPILIANPHNPAQIFIIGGTIQGLTNEYVYHFCLNKQEKYEWVRQKQKLKCVLNHCQLIVEMDRIFLLAFQNVGNEKDVKCELTLIELEVLHDNLVLKQINQLNKTVNSLYLLPLRAKDNEYILIDLTNKQSPLYLDLSRSEIIKNHPIKQDIRKFIKQLYDNRNQRSIFSSYPACSITHNQINYNIISHSVAKHTFKILYGCDDEWMVSDLGQTLIHD